MGIYDRDYYRGESEGIFASWGRWSATTWLVLITCVVFVMQILSRDLGRNEVMAFGCYEYSSVAEGEVWRLLTCIFLHDTNNLLHIVFNMLILYWTGRALEEKYGRAEFVVFYLASGTLANLGVFLLELAGVKAPSLIIGASGAVTAALVLFALNFPHTRVLLFFLIPMPVWGVVVLYVVLDVLGASGMGRGNVAYLVHLFGAVFGTLYFVKGLRFTGFMPGKVRRATVRTPPRLRIVPQDDDEPEPEPAAVVHAENEDSARIEEPLESKLDRVLEKVSKHGQESLSGEEREILFRASEVYKKRRK